MATTVILTKYRKMSKINSLLSHEYEMNYSILKYSLLPFKNAKRENL